METSAGSTSASTGAATPTTSTSGASDSEATPTTSGSQSATASDDTGAPLTSSTDASSTTTGADMACLDMPPPGFDGAQNPGCAAEPQVGVFKPVVEWSRDAWAVEPASNQVLMTPVIASLDDDNNDGKADENDLPDVIFVTYNPGNHYGPGVLRAMSGDGAKEVLNVAGKEVCGHSGLAVGDIDNDGRLEIITVSVKNELKRFEHDGTLTWTSKAYGPQALHCGSYPSIADLDGDGTPEIVAGAIILNADGSERGVGQHGNAFFISTVADLDQDGEQEVIVGNAVYDDKGATVWFNGMGDGYPGVADFDADGEPEIVVSSSGTVRLQDALGAVIWSTPVPGGAGGAPTIADYDGDGEPEVGVAGSEFYVVFDTDGAVMWQMPIDETDSATGSVVYDFEGDGIADVIHADEQRLWVFDGTDGAVKLSLAAHGSATQYESPSVADLDADGQVEIIFGNNQFYGPQFPKGITVVGDMDKSWRPGREIWNQYSYNITNINDDGSVPAMPAPNWKLHNNFRSGDLSPADGAAAPDLKLKASVCQFQCLEQSLQLWVNLGNEGASPLTAGATISVYGVKADVETLITELPFLDILEAGKYADALGFQIDGSDYELLRVRATANEEECMIDNNQLELESPFCSPPG